MRPDDVGKALHMSAREILKQYRKRPRPVIQVVVYSHKQEVVLISQIHCVCIEEMNGGKTREDEKKAFALANRVCNHIQFVLLTLDEYRRSSGELAPGYIFNGDLKKILISGK